MKNICIKKDDTSFVKIIKTIGFVIVGIVFAAIIAIVLGYVVMHLWNWLMPDLFSITTITFWQSVGVVVLARLIFGGFKHPHNDKHHEKFAEKFRKKHPKFNNGPNYDKWEHYDEFWKEKGEQAFNEYVENKGE